MRSGRSGRPAEGRRARRGNDTLIAWETSLTGAGFAEINLLALAVQRDPAAQDDAAAEDVEQASGAVEGEPD
jgi:hypothetical protein